MSLFGPSRLVRDTAQSIETLANGVWARFGSMPSDKLLAVMQKDYPDQHLVQGDMIRLALPNITLILVDFQMPLNGDSREIDFAGRGEFQGLHLHMHGDRDNWYVAAADEPPPYLQSTRMARQLSRHLAKHMGITDYNELMKSMPKLPF